VLAPGNSEPRCRARTGIAPIDLVQRPFRNA
jgi:hypothetical protein